MGDVKTGESDVKADLPAHTKGIKQGNSKGNYERQAGHEPDGRRSARASTGVNPDAHEPIDPSMTNLSPA
jgi:hypothetical protein